MLLWLLFIGSVQLVCSQCNHTGLEGQLSQAGAVLLASCTSIASQGSMMFHREMFGTVTSQGTMHVELLQNSTASGVLSAVPIQGTLAGTHTVVSSNTPSLITVSYTQSSTGVVTVTSQQVLSGTFVWRLTNLRVTGSSSFLVDVVWRAGVASPPTAPSPVSTSPPSVGVSRSCEELGWNVGISEHYPKVCASSLVNGGQCAKHVLFSRASALCGALGARLCDHQELVADVAVGTGCGLDVAAVWSSTGCGGDKVIVGPGAAVGLEDVPIECVLKTGSQLVGTRCCADKAAVTPAPSLSPTTPSRTPTPLPTDSPTPHPSRAPSRSPTPFPTPAPDSLSPTAPTRLPTQSPVAGPSTSPAPSVHPSLPSSSAPSTPPPPSSSPPSVARSASPPSSPVPSLSPTATPSLSPSAPPSTVPPTSPSPSPSSLPSLSPPPSTRPPSLAPTPLPSNEPTDAASASPSSSAPSHAVSPSPSQPSSPSASSSSLSPSLPPSSSLPPTSLAPSTAPSVPETWNGGVQASLRLNRDFEAFSEADLVAVEAAVQAYLATRFEVSGRVRNLTASAGSVIVTMTVVAGDTGQATSGEITQFLQTGVEDNNSTLHTDARMEGLDGAYFASKQVDTWEQPVSEPVPPWWHGAGFWGLPKESWWAIAGGVVVLLVAIFVVATCLCCRWCQCCGPCCGCLKRSRHKRLSDDPGAHGQFDSFSSRKPGRRDRDEAVKKGRVQPASAANNKWRNSAAVNGPSRDAEHDALPVAVHPADAGDPSQEKLSIMRNRRRLSSVVKILHRPDESPNSKNVRSPTNLPSPDDRRDNAHSGYEETFSPPSALIAQYPNVALLFNFLTSDENQLFQEYNGQRVAVYEPQIVRIIDFAQGVENCVSILRRWNKEVAAAGKEPFTDFNQAIDKMHLEMMSQQLLPRSTGVMKRRDSLLSGAVWDDGATLTSPMPAKDEDVYVGRQAAARPMAHRPSNHNNNNNHNNNHHTHHSNNSNQGSHAQSSQHHGAPRSQPQQAYGRGGEAAWGADQWNQARPLDRGQGDYLAPPVPAWPPAQEQVNSRNNRVSVDQGWATSAPEHYQSPSFNASHPLRGGEARREEWGGGGVSNNANSSQWGNSSHDQHDSSQAWEGRGPSRWENGVAVAEYPQSRHPWLSPAHAQHGQR